MLSSSTQTREEWKKKSHCSNHSIGEDSNVSTTSSLGSSSVDVDCTTPKNSALPRMEGKLWSQPDASCFKIRSKNYITDGKKNPSDPYLFPARGAELFLTEDCPENVAKTHSHVLLDGELRTKPTFIVNYRFPWGVLLLYFEIPEEYVGYLSGSKSVERDGRGLRPAEQCICSFLEEKGSVFASSAERRNAILKFIPVVPDGPWVIQKMVTGKPVLIGQKLPLQYHSQHFETQDGLSPYLEADLDVGNSSNRARKITSMCKKFMNSLTLDFGFVIQGNSFEELPEQMLGCVRLHSFDPTLAPRLPPPCI